MYWVQELLPALLLLMLLQIASAGVFAHLLPEVSFATALYHCFITATTVGYGDVPITTRAAQWHKRPAHLPSLPSHLRLAAPYTAYGRQPAAYSTQLIAINESHGSPCRLESSPPGAPR